MDVTKFFRYFAKKRKNMATAVLHQDSRSVTLKMSLSRWKRLQKLEDSYKVASAISRALKSVESAPAMSAEEGINLLRSL